MANDMNSLCGGNASLGINDLEYRNALHKNVVVLANHIGDKKVRRFS